MAEARTKGSHVLSAVRLLRSSRERALELLPRPLHSYLEERILPSKWYPLADHLALLDAIARLWPTEGVDPWLMMGQVTAQIDLTGIYKLYLKPGNVPGTLNALSILWTSAQDSGEASVTIDDAQHATLTLEDFGARSRSFCRVMTGYVQEVMRMAGGIGQVEHTRCRENGAPKCVWQAHWQKMSGF